MTEFRVTYTGGLPTGSNTSNLINTTLMNSRPFMLGFKRAQLSIKHDQAGTLKAYWSNDGGTTWYQFYDSGSIAAPTYTTDKDIYIEGHRDFKLDWVNGGVNQGTFVVSLVMSEERALLALIYPGSPIIDLRKQTSNRVIGTGGISNWISTDPATEDFSQGTAGARPQDIADDGADFDGTDDRLQSTNTVATLLGTTGYYLIAAATVRTVTTNTSNWWQDDALLTDNGGFMGLHFRSAPNVTAFHYDGAAKVTSSLAISLNTRYVFVWGHDGTNITLKILGGSTATPAAAGALSNATNVLNLGSSANAYGIFTEIDIHAILGYGTWPSAADRAAIEALFNAENG